MMVWFRRLGLQRKTFIYVGAGLMALVGCYDINKQRDNYIASAIFVPDSSASAATEPTLILKYLFNELLSTRVYCRSVSVSEEPIHPFSLYTTNVYLLLKTLCG